MNRSLKIFALVVSCIGVVVPFLPFSDGVSPLDTLTQFIGPGLRLPRLALLGAPFFLPIGILAWQLRGLKSNRLTRAEFVAAYLLSAAAMLSVAAFVVWALIEGGLPRNNVRDLVTFASVPVTISVIALLLLRNRRAMVSRECAAEVFMLGGYLPNAITCLVGFWGNLQVGANLALAVSVGYVAVMALLSRGERRPSAAASPG